MKNFKNFSGKETRKEIAAFVKSFTGVKVAINHKGVEALYFHVLSEGEATHASHIRYQNTTGSGRFTSAYRDWSAEIKSVLDAINIKYSQGNDAPKGGKNGDFIKIEISERDRITQEFERFINK